MLRNGASDARRAGRWGTPWCRRLNEPVPSAFGHARLNRHLQELPDVAPVHAHGGHLGAAVLVELVATRLATKSIQKKLLAYITES